MTTDPTLTLGVPRQARSSGAARARPVWAILTGPYALLLLFLLIVPLANVALFSIHRYSPTKVALPELTFDNFRKIADLYYLRLFARTLKLGLITTVICAVLGYPLAYWLARVRPRLQAIGMFFPDHAADGQRGDPDLWLDRHSRTQRATQRGACRVGPGTGPTALHRYGCRDRPGQRLPTVYGIAADGG